MVGNELNSEFPGSPGKLV